MPSWCARATPRWRPSRRTCGIKTGSSPRVEDLVIIGSFEAVDTGRTAERVVPGLGSGATDLRAAAEGDPMTAQGLRRLGSGTRESRGGQNAGGGGPPGGRRRDWPPDRPDRHECGTRGRGGDRQQHDCAGSPADVRVVLTQCAQNVMFSGRMARFAGTHHASFAPNVRSNRHGSHVGRFMFSRPYR